MPPSFKCSGLQSRLLAQFEEGGIQNSVKYNTIFELHKRYFAFL